MQTTALAILLGFAIAPAAILVRRVFKRHAGFVIALYPLVVFILFLLHLLRGAPPETVQWRWIPALGVDFVFHFDGLSTLMGLIVSGIGTLVVLYGGAYLEKHPGLEKFYGFIILFMVAMLGLISAGNVLLLFMFWELTGISSFFLIGFENNRPAARAAAWQALLVTGAGGLAMLAGAILLAQISGSYIIQDWVAQPGVFTSNPLSVPAFILILLGAMTKSAQFPFHFWLPNAMEAPTPVSAYLHSATMVKAGVYLLARLFPVLGGLALWGQVLPWVGLATLLAGALLALGQTDLKRLLAYTTVAALGVPVMLLGIGQGVAIKAALLYLLAHALYKGALFLTAGGVDHAVHTRDINELGGLARAMPFTAAAAGLAALSMAGFPLVIGYLAKETLYDAALPVGLGFVALIVLANVGIGAVSGWVGLLPYWMKTRAEDKLHHAHEGRFPLWLGPLLLALLGTVLGLFPSLAAKIVQPAVEAVYAKAYPVKLALWHGLNTVFFLSLATILASVLVFFLRSRFQAQAGAFFHRVAGVGPAHLYTKGLNGLLAFAGWLTRIVQNGYLRVYIAVIVLFTVILSGFMYLLRITRLPTRPGETFAEVWGVPRFYDVILVLVILTAAVLVTRTSSRLTTIALLGTIGYSIALLYLLYSAPDLAMVQFAIETLTVILFILVIYRLPKFSRFSSTREKRLDALIALGGGAMMTLLMLLSSSNPAESRLAAYFAQNSFAAANGRNIVNVILVDFRGFDTLGEITVLAVAAVGVFALIRLGARGDTRRKKGPLMQRSIILPVAARYLIPLLLIFSFFLLIRGHNEIGGGFAGGLVASSALMLYAIANSPGELRRLLPVQPKLMVAMGLLVALVSGLISLVTSKPMMTGLWLKQPLPILGKMGTPVLFDVGVYLVVIGIVTWILLTLAEEQEAV